MIFSLMKKDYPIAGLDIDENGKIQHISIAAKYRDLLPLAYQNDPVGLKKWWDERSTPASHDFLERMIKEQGLSCPSEFLVRNLGLSLTDHYWIKPVKSDLTWDAVNLFTNDFKNEIFLRQTDEANQTLSYSPNSSLKGELEKSWNILKGMRVLIKGNHGGRSTESMNEVIASKLHQLQGFSNHADYGLIKVHGREYDYGCYSKLFTSGSLELVSAHDLLSSEKQPNDISSYEFLIRLAAKYGLDENSVRLQLEYQIMTDFVLTNTDRHMNNIAFLMDETNRFVAMAPIFDTGKSLFVDQSDFSDTEELLSIRTNSFRKKEVSLLSYVRDKNVVDLTKVPGADVIQEMYRKDDKISEKYIKRVCEGYEKKIELCRGFQLGKALHHIG